MAKLSEKYEEIMREKGYESIEEMCNDLSLNYEDVLEDEDD